MKNWPDGSITRMMECSSHIPWQVETWTRTSTPLRWRTWTTKWLEWWIPTYSIGWVGILVLIFQNIFWKLIFVKCFGCRRRQCNAEHGAAVPTRSGRRTGKPYGIWRITRHKHLALLLSRIFFRKKYKTKGKFTFFMLCNFCLKGFSFHNVESTWPVCLFCCGRVCTINK